MKIRLCPLLGGCSGHNEGQNEPWTSEEAPGTNDPPLRQGIGHQGESNGDKELDKGRRDRACRWLASQGKLVKIKTRNRVPPGMQCSLQKRRS